MRYLFLSLLVFLTGWLSGQDLVYTISARSGNDSAPLDSILVENISNKTRILFGNLPPRKDYIINLTQRAFQGTTASGLTRENQFRIILNRPGELTITLGDAVSGKGSVSVFNLLGQKLMEENNLSFYPYQILSLKVGVPGHFLVKVFCRGETRSFKVQGTSTGGMIRFGQQAGNRGEVFLKKGSTSDKADFQFLAGDSLRISVYRNSYYAYPQSFRISYSSELTFSLLPNTGAISGISNAYVSLSGNYTMESFDPGSGIALLIPVGSAAPLKYGDVFVAENDSTGYLRKVISKANQEGKIVVKTIPAGLHEVFVNKELKMSTVWMDPLLPVTEKSTPGEISRAFTDAEGVSHPVVYVHTSDDGKLQIYSPLLFPGSDKPLFPTVYIDNKNVAGNVNAGNLIQFKLVNGNLQFFEEGELSFRFKGNGRLDEATKTELGEVGWGRVSISGQAKVKSGVAVDIKGPILLSIPAQKAIPGQKVSVKFLIDGIPVWMDMVIDLRQQAEIETTGGLHAAWNLDHSFSFNQGWDYSGEKGIFSPLFSGNTAYQSQSVSVSGNSDGKVHFSLYPSTEIRLFGMPLFSARQMPFSGIEHSARIHQVTTATGNREFTAWNSLLREGADLQTSGDLQGAGLEGLKFDSGKRELSNAIRWNAPEKLSMQPLPPGKVHLSSRVNLLFRVTDSSGQPVSDCTVYIKGDGSFREQILPSNSGGEATFEWTVGSKPGFNDFTAQIFNGAKEVISVVKDSMEVYDKDAYGTLTYDGKAYKTKKFGNAVWMVENLAYLPSVTPPTPGSNTEPYYYVKGYYGSSVAEAKQVPGYAAYGVYYNWKAATKEETPVAGGTIRGICPQGWHIPGEQDWADLWAYLVDNGYGFGGSGNRIAKAMASKSGWNTTSYSGTPGNDPGSNNSSEFNALPGGFRCTDALDFVQEGMFASWWQAVPRDETNGYHWGFNYNTSQLVKYYSPRGRGYFVRCVKD